MKNMPYGLFFVFLRKHHYCNNIKYQMVEWVSMESWPFKASCVKTSSFGRRVFGNCHGCE